MTLHEVYIWEIAMHDGQMSLRKIERDGVVNSLAKRRGMSVRNRTMRRQVPEGGREGGCVCYVRALRSVSARHSLTRARAWMIPKERQKHKSAISKVNVLKHDRPFANDPNIQNYYMSDTRWQLLYVMQLQ